MSKENYPGSEEARTPIMENGNLQVTNRPGLVRRQLFADPQDFTGRDAITAGVSQVIIDAAKHLDVDESKKVKRTPPIRSQGESMSSRPLLDLPFLDVEVGGYASKAKAVDSLLVLEQSRENNHPDRPQIDTMQIYRDIKAARKGLPNYSLDTVVGNHNKTPLEMIDAENISLMYHPCINWSDFKDLSVEERRTIMKLVRMGNRHPTHKVDYIGRTKRGLIFMTMNPNWGLK